MVCGVKQHTGKTSVCMALFSNLRQQLSPASVGYMKPIGQEWVEVHSEGEGEGSLLRVDKDAALPDLAPAGTDPRTHFSRWSAQPVGCRPLPLSQAIATAFVDENFGDYNEKTFEDVR